MKSLFLLSRGTDIPESFGRRPRSFHSGNLVIRLSQKTIGELPSSLLGSKSFAPSLFGSLMIKVRGTEYPHSGTRGIPGEREECTHRQRHCWTFAQDAGPWVGIHSLLSLTSRRFMMVPSEVLFLKLRWAGFGGDFMNFESTLWIFQRCT